MLSTIIPSFFSIKLMFCCSTVLRVYFSNLDLNNLFEVSGSYFIVVNEIHYQLFLYNLKSIYSRSTVIIEKYHICEDKKFIWFSNGSDIHEVICKKVEAIDLQDDPKEWFIIELQGFLETEQTDLAGIRIGDLHFDKQGTASLLIGHHVLTGKATSLDKPFGVMRKRVTSCAVGDDNVMEVDEVDRQTSYDIVAFVKQKIIFKNRPRPIIVK